MHADLVGPVADGGFRVQGHSSALAPLLGPGPGGLQAGAGVAEVGGGPEGGGGPGLRGQLAILQVGSLHVLSRGGLA